MFTGKERDAETGLDYFGARYMSAAQGRFTSPDIPLIDQHVHDPQSWNLYAYGRNNPLKNVDPTGNVVETIWDIANVGLDLYSLGSNLYQGNFGSAAVDAGGLILDAAATVVPFVPGGAGTAIKAARAADTVVDAARGLNKADSVADAAKAADNATDLSKVGRSGKQEKLREVAGDQKAASSDRGWIKQEQNSIDRGQRTTIRNPPGKDLAHERGREAAKGYSYKHSKLQNRADHQRQHRYDDYGRKNKERPLKQGEQ
jgi:RHS repeat-associated protein